MVDTFLLGQSVDNRAVMSKSVPSTRMGSFVAHERVVYDNYIVWGGTGAPSGDGSRRCIEATTYRAIIGEARVYSTTTSIPHVEATSLLQLFGFKFLLFDFEEFVHLPIS